MHANPQINHHKCIQLARATYLYQLNILKTHQVSHTLQKCMRIQEKRTMITCPNVVELHIALFGLVLQHHDALCVSLLLSKPSIFTTIIYVHKNIHDRLFQSMDSSSQINQYFVCNNST